MALAQRPYVEFKENKGQWNEKVKFSAKLPAGDLFLEKNALTYRFYNESDLDRIDELHHQFIKNPTHQDSIIRMHAFQIEFKNALIPSFETTKIRPDYENYFIGNDQSKWASNVKKYEEVTYKALYKNIDLQFYLKEGVFKYDFIVKPGGNVNQIELFYKGTDELFLKNGNLHIKTSVNEIIEQKPFAYQIVNGESKEVKCNFELIDNVLSFKFPKGYNKQLPLIIDPALVFASYSGATVDNWGYTSTFNAAGNLFGGGVSFGTGYPTTLGAFQTLFGGGAMDISISKFSTNGSLLEYSTYLGGSNADYPHSLIVNSNNELLVFGTTASPNFPTTAGAYSTTLNGGSDTYVAKFSANGQTLIASTFVGGSLDDGLNNTAPLKYNYADDHRGEIILDANDNVLVATNTRSADFPITSGVIQTGNLGLSDACVYKLSPNLNNLLFSTFLGGTGLDAAYSLQLASNGDILVTGGTNSTNFPTTAGTLNPTSLGNTDGWVARLNSTATNLIASTYIGTAANYNQCYFVQLDTADNVYVVGQTVGVYPIFPATVYNNPNSGQFIHKLTPNLASTVFSTTFGTSSGLVDIALSAFLVNECNYILISGWGGAVNGSASATASTTTGLPITAGAIQPTTDGSDYYLVMFSENADTILYSTFFGGNASFDHVDGGTSRFDKKGIVYQAVCASCFGSTSDFPTTPGAWSSSDNGPNCNLGVFKMDLTRLTADAEVFTTPFYCVGDTVHFQNLSNGGVSYLWDFQDGNTSTDFQPKHVFDSIGTYHVLLVALDSISCTLVDSDFVDVFIGGPPTATINPINGVCRGDSIQLNVSNGASYLWTPAYNITNDTIDNPFVYPDTTTLYTVIVFDSCGTDTAQILVTVFQKNIAVSPDALVCLGQNTQLTASGGVSYAWQPATSLNNPTIANPIATPTANTIYTVTVTDPNGCVWDTSATVLIDNVVPIAQTMNDTTICNGDTILIYGTGGQQYNWTPSSSLLNPTDSSTLAFPTQNTTYILEAINGCGNDFDTLNITVVNPFSTIVDDTTVCVGDRVNLWATGGETYLWSPTIGMNNPNISNPSATIFDTTTFFVAITDTNGCKSNLSVFVDTLKKPTVNLGFDIKTTWGSVVQLNAISNGVAYNWSPTTGLSCTNCLNPIVNSTESITYALTVKGANGCFNTDTITILFDGAIYLPNSFTPDGDGLNDLFYAIGVDIIEFEIFIFNRWGEQIFYADNMETGWDGTYKGTLVKNDTYVWKVIYKDILKKRGELYGKVTLVR